MREFSVGFDGLRLRALIGFQPWELEKPQDVVVHIRLKYDAEAAAASDSPDDAVDYKAISKTIIALVEGSSFKMLEALASAIYDAVKTPQISYLDVRVEKPHALRFVDSVWVRVEGP